MTRGYPMEFHEGEKKDHPHHHSFWVAHGDVNGTDNWSIADNCGSTKQIEILANGIHPRLWPVSDKQRVVNT